MTPTESPLNQDKRDLFRASWGNIAGFLMRLCSRVPLLFIAGQLYGQSRYGEYVFATALIHTLTQVAGFGFKRTLFRFIYEESSRGEAYVLRHVLLLTVTLGLGLAAVLAVTARHVAAVFHVPGASTAISICASAIPFMAATDVLLTATWARRIIRYEVFVRSLVEPATLTIVAFVLFKLGYVQTGMIVAFMCAAALSFVAAIGSVARLYGLHDLCRLEIRWAYVTRLLRESASTFVHELLGIVLSYIDVFAVGFFFSEAAVGLYGMAQQFLTIVEKIALSFYPMLTPLLTQALKVGHVDRAYGQVIAVARRIVKLQAPIVVLYLAFGGYLLAIIGPEFRQSWPILIVLTLGAWVNGTLGLSEQALVLLSPSANPKASLVALATYLAAVYPVQLLFGVPGVAVTSILAVLVGNFVRVISCYRRLAQFRREESDEVVAASLASPR